MLCKHDIRVDPFKSRVHPSQKCTYISNFPEALLLNSTEYELSHTWLGIIESTSRGMRLGGLKPTFLFGSSDTNLCRTNNFKFNTDTHLPLCMCILWHTVCILTSIRNRLILVNVSVIHMRMKWHDVTVFIGKTSQLHIYLFMSKHLFVCVYGILVMPGIASKTNSIE